MNIRSPYRALAAITVFAAVGLSVAACSSDPETSPSTAATAPSSAASEAPPVVGDASLDGMRILLTNDDSMQAARENNSDGLGLYEMRKALCGAGADVVVIAPWAVQSGRGTAVTNSGTFTAQPATLLEDYADDCASAPSAGAVFGLCIDEGECTPDSPSGTPSDTVKFAMRGGLTSLVGWEDRPDLVITGPNAGLNLASSVTDSGTVGAAIAGVEHHVPAVAFSTQSSPDGAYPRENYAATATWAVDFLESLASRAMLDQHSFVVNVNYPDSTSGEVNPAQFVEVGTAAFAYHHYTATDANSFEIGLMVCEGVDLCEESKADADWQIVRENRTIGVGALAPDRTYGPDTEIVPELAELKAFVATAAPAPAN